MQILALLPALALAVYREDAFSIDWVHRGLGLPVSVEDVAENLAIVSNRDVLAVVDSEGDMLWRRILNEGTASHGVAVAEDTVITGGDVLTGWNASSGAVLWTKQEPTQRVYSVDGRAFAVSPNDKFEIRPNGNLEPASAPEPPSHLRSRKGTIQLYPGDTVVLFDDNNKVIWRRDESLASVTSAIFVDVPQPKPVKPKTPKPDVGEIYGKGKRRASIKFDESTLFGAWQARLHKHLSEAKSFSQLIKGIWRAVRGTDATRDAKFGFNKYLVVTTSSGIAHALDVQNDGKTVWLRQTVDGAKLIGTNEEGQIVAKTGSTSEVWDVKTGEVIATIDSETEVIPPSDLPYKYSGSTLTGAAGWEFTAEGKIVAVAQRHALDRTASIGVVLPDNSVLYKYLNPNAVAVAAIDDENKLSVSLLDGVTGRLLATGVQDEKVVGDVNLSFGEHWIVYTFQTTDGPRVALWDMFESAEPNERVSQEGEVSAYGDGVEPVIKMRTFTTEWPSAVRALAISRTKFGVTTRDIVAAIDGQVIALPKLMLSAPETNVIGVPQEGHLSHVQDVWGIDEFTVEAAELESTYHLAGFGSLDVFYTRAAPSGEFDKLPDSFGKKKLVAILVSLAMVVFIVIPLSRRQQNQLLWR